jgi:hypothetical protein
LPFLALAVVTVLLSHDLIMTTGPHNLAAYASDGHHGQHDAHFGDVVPHDPSVNCGSFEAVRATNGNAFDGDHMVSGQASAFEALDLSRPVMTALAELGAPPDQIRAMLQVYLN